MSRPAAPSATVDDRPLVISVPNPRSLALILTDARRRQLFDTYQVVECEPGGLAALTDPVLAAARYIVGQPPIDAATLERLPLNFLTVYSSFRSRSRPRPRARPRFVPDIRVILNRERNREWERAGEARRCRILHRRLAAAGLSFTCDGS